MEQLTGWDGEYPYILKCFENDGCEDMDTSKCDFCEHVIAAYGKLAAYEDTGLSPADVSELPERFGGQPLEAGEQDAELQGRQQ